MSARPASAIEEIENVVLGGGEAGKYIAWELAKQGRPVMVIERALVGGSCPNVACLPSKNIIRSAKVADIVGRYPLHQPRLAKEARGSATCAHEGNDESEMGGTGRRMEEKREDGGAVC